MLLTLLMDVNRGSEVRGTFVFVGGYVVAFCGVWIWSHLGCFPGPHTLAFLVWGSPQTEKNYAMVKSKFYWNPFWTNHFRVKIKPWADPLCHFDPDEPIPGEEHVFSDALLCTWQFHVHRCLSRCMGQVHLHESSTCTPDFMFIVVYLAVLN